MSDLIGILIVKEVDLAQLSINIPLLKPIDFLKFDLPQNSVYIPLKNKSVIKVGRSSSAILCFSPFVSRLHFSIWTAQFDSNTPPITYIHDHSSNGTFLDGVKIGKSLTTILPNASTIFFGPFSIDYIAYPFLPSLEFSFQDSLSSISSLSTSLVGWELSSFLGSGAYGSVYIAKKSNSLAERSNSLFAEKSNSLFACKIIKNLSNLVLRDNMMQEVEILKQIDHVSFTFRLGMFSEGVDVTRRY